MIFNVPGHIDMIRKGQKTQTRRLNRGVYHVGRDYAVQRKRGVNAEKNIRIMMDKIEVEGMTEYHAAVLLSQHGIGHPISQAHISKGDAWAEGNYTPSLYESDFIKAYPKWDGWSRWVFNFHVIEVQK